MHIYVIKSLTGTFSIQPGDFFGGVVYFTTAYFVDPAVICNGGRSQLQFQAQGTGDRLLFQTGPTPDAFLEAPLTQVGRQGGRDGGREGGLEEGRKEGG